MDLLEQRRHSAVSVALVFLRLSVSRLLGTADFHQQQGSWRRHSRAALRYYLTASLFQLDFDKEDEADQGDHDKESQENPHVKVFRGLLEQNTDTMTHSSLQPKDLHTGCVGPGRGKDGQLRYTPPHLQGTPGGSANAHTMCYSGPGSNLRRGQGEARSGLSQAA